MTHVREAMVVAGGAGTRLRPLTAATPKPLVPFCGAPFLAGVVRRLAQVGVERVLLVVGAETAPFERFAADQPAGGPRVEIVPEPEPLDTAGGVRGALDQVSGPFLVLNGDILTDVDLATVVATHGRRGADATLVLTRVEDTSTFGVCVLDGDRIVDFVEKPAPGTLPGQDAVNAGTYVLEPDALARFPQGRLSFERAVFPALVAEGALVTGFVSDAVWADLGTPERYLAGQRLALSGALAWPTLDEFPVDAAGRRLAPGVHLAEGVVVDGPVLFGEGVEIGAQARIGPNVVLGAGVRVGAGTRLADAAVLDGSALGSDVRADGLLTGRDVRVGAGADLGRGAVLGDGEQVPDSVTLPDGARLPAPSG